MRVLGIGQEKPNRHTGVLRAGAMGAVAGAAVRNLAPLTKDEHDVFLNSSVVDAVKNKAKNVRINEAHTIVEEISNKMLNISDEAKDIFTSKASLFAVKPESAGEYIKDASKTVKDEVGGLVSRVALAGAAKERVEFNSIKSAAKAERPLAYFMAAGALIAMTSKILVNAFRSLNPKEAEKPEKQTLTMADVLLEGLGSNTEVLFLTNDPKIK